MIWRTVPMVLVLSACGGEEPRPSTAPVPAAWAREDQGEPAPGSITLGSRAEPGAPAPQGPVAHEQAARRDLSAVLSELWAAEPGLHRANAICGGYGRVSDASHRWLGAVRDSYPDRRARLDPRPLQASVRELGELCDAGVGDTPEPVEGALQGVAHEVEALSGQIEAGW